MEQKNYITQKDLFEDQAILNSFLIYCLMQSNANWQESTILPQVNLFVKKPTPVQKNQNKNNNYTDESNNSNLDNQKKEDDEEDEDESTFLKNKKIKPNTSDIKNLQTPKSEQDIQAEIAALQNDYMHRLVELKQQISQCNYDKQTEQIILQTKNKYNINLNIGDQFMQNDEQEEGYSRKGKTIKYNNNESFNSQEDQSENPHNQHQKKPHYDKLQQNTNSNSESNGQTLPYNLCEKKTKEDTKNLLRNYGSAQNRFVLHNQYSNKKIEKYFSQDQEKIEEFKKWVTQLKLENFEQFKAVWHVVKDEQYEQFKDLYREICFDFYENHASVYVLSSQMRSGDTRKTHIKYICRFLEGILDPSCFYYFKKNNQ